MGLLSGKTICVTGAAHGLGAACALDLAGRGARVVCADIDGAAAAKVANEIGPAAHWVEVDVSDWDAGERLVVACRDHGGRIDGLVNNAGVLVPARLQDVTEADIDRTLAVNLKGSFGVGRAAIMAMRDQGGGGSVVNVTSGSQAGDLALSVYAATKGGVASMTYSWAMECRGSAIRVNAISPLANTAMARANQPFLAAQSDNREVVYQDLPEAEINTPAVAWLLSDRAAGVNGQVVRIAGQELSLVTHPQIAHPVLTGEWTLEAIDLAFDSGRIGRPATLGLSRQR